MNEMMHVQTAERPKLGSALIYRTALELVDQNGFDSLSMRGLAKVMGVDPMALYHHVPKKSALLDGMLNLLFEEVVVPSISDLPWQEAVVAVARTHLEVARRHPNLFPALSVHPRAVPASFPLSEALYEALSRSGASEATVIQAAETVASYTTGYALSDIVGAIGKPRDWESLSENFDHRPDGWLCNLRERSGADRPDFETGLQFILAGVAASVR